MFGAPLEQTWGEKRFLLYYLVCVAGAGVCQLLVGTLLENPATVLGASGGVFGLLLAYGMLFPNQRVMLLFPPIPMKARTFVILFGVGELVLGMTGWQPGVAHFAPGRHAVRLVADPLLAWAAAVQAPPARPTEAPQPSAQRQMMEGSFDVVGPTVGRHAFYILRLRSCTPPAPRCAPAHR